MDRLDLTPAYWNATLTPILQKLAPITYYSLKLLVKNGNQFKLFE